MERIVVGLTGASGSLYAKRLVEVLLEQGLCTHLVATDMGKKVLTYEVGTPYEVWTAALQARYPLFTLEENANLFSGIASGSNGPFQMVIAPCSMGTLAKLSQGVAENLLLRAADVALKEKRKLIIVPRETPLHAIHLENMLRLSQVGAVILPAMPGFYHQPQTLEELVDFVVGKILSQLALPQHLLKKWEDPS
jgi:4-hydroxy-3-polyprenylbenzoate decarboxylase